MEDVNNVCWKSIMGINASIFLSNLIYEVITSSL